MKKLLVLAVLGAIATLFTACEEPLTSCDVKMNLVLVETHQCAETSEKTDYLEEKCKDYSAKAQLLGGTAVTGSGCPGGYVKICSYSGIKGDVYFYDTADADKSCDALLSGTTW